LVVLPLPNILLPKSQYASAAVAIAGPKLHCCGPKLKWIPTQHIRYSSDWGIPHTVYVDYTCHWRPCLKATTRSTRHTPNLFNDSQENELHQTAVHYYEALLQSQSSCIVLLRTVTHS
jgi:hypothetical protein